MPQGLPIPGDTVRQTWGQGVRSGMYPLSKTELYWFTCFNAPKVGCVNVWHWPYRHHVTLFTAWTCCLHGLYSILANQC